MTEQRKSTARAEGFRCSRVRGLEEDVEHLRGFSREERRHGQRAGWESAMAVVLVEDGRE